jgi:branched-chain amino acid transport system permease protein
MELDSLAVHTLGGLANASSLFLVAAGLSLIFGVTRVVNFAHGSLYMLGLYLAYTLANVLAVPMGSAWGFWVAIVLAGLLVGLLGAVVEMGLLRRVYAAPELFQLLATFALVLVLKDAALWLFGPEDLLGPRAPGLKDAVQIGDQRLPSYDLFLIVVGPIVLGLMWGLLHRTRWGTLVRAATEDREMLGALGVNQKWLYTSVFALGAMLAGLGGALQLPREPAHLGLDMQIIGEAFVVVVVGGLGSLPGAFVAALLIALIKALCIALGTVQWLGWAVEMPKLALVLEFVVMAAVLILKPAGLMGKPQVLSRNFAPPEEPLKPLGQLGRQITLALVLGAAMVPYVLAQSPYATVLGIDLLTALLLAVSLHFLMGPAGLHSFGHAAFFGIGAYAAALLVTRALWPMEVALLIGPWVSALAGLLVGAFCVRLSGVYLAMLTLAFAQIVWSVVFQWDGITGGSNGINGVWPAAWLAQSGNFYYLCLALVTLSVLALRRVLFSPYGYALRAGRDSPVRAAAIGLPLRSLQWAAFGLSGLLAGLAGALFTFSKGSISPDSLGVGRSVDALVMVLLGGVQHLAGPLVGAVTFTWLQDTVSRSTDYWRAALGGIMVVLVLLFPQGLVGLFNALATLVQKLGLKARRAGGHS